MKPTEAYGHQPIAQTLAELQTEVAQGLSALEVQHRLAQYGRNAITTREESVWHRIGRRFWGPIPWMIELAAMLSAAVGKWEDFGIILTLLLVNVALDFFQEYRAFNALQALKASLAIQARALREGRFHGH